MKTVLFIALGGCIVLALVWLRARLVGFAAQRPRDYADGAPQFDLRRHLNGAIACEGVIYGPFGRVTSRFVGEFHAEWAGNTGLMRERFTYDSGAVQDRKWHLSIGNDGTIRATAPDVVGVAIGTQRGSAVRLCYRLCLPQDAGGHVLNVVDWMYLAPNGHIVNRSQFRKFGVTVAELVATMRPAPALDSETQLDGRAA